MIRIGREIQCLPYAGFFFNTFLTLFTGYAWNVFLFNSKFSDSKIQTWHKI